MLKRKDKILISAIELLDADGVSGITTKRLAEVQGVSEPALYRQYTSKQAIIKAIIEEYIYYDQKIINTIMERNIQGSLAILFYVDRFTELYTNYSELTTVMFSMDLYQYNEETKAMMKNTTEKRLAFLKGVIIRTQLDVDNQMRYSAEELASMINGIIFSQTYEWRISEKAFDLQVRIRNLINKLLH